MVQGCVHAHGHGRCFGCIAVGICSRFRHVSRSAGVHLQVIYRCTHPVIQRVLRIRGTGNLKCGPRAGGSRHAHIHIAYLRTARRLLLCKVDVRLGNIIQVLIRTEGPLVSHCPLGRLGCLGIRLCHSCEQDGNHGGYYHHTEYFCPHFNASEETYL